MADSGVLPVSRASNSTLRPLMPPRWLICSMASMAPLRPASPRSAELPGQLANVADTDWRLLAAAGEQADGEQAAAISLVVVGFMRWFVFSQGGSRDAGEIVLPRHDAVGTPFLVGHVPPTIRPDVADPVVRARAFTPATLCSKPSGRVP